jgi:cytochrome c-type biogenesis protein CcmH|tara:strand:+ start:781 stop:1185 length:405 start_codon:yes stop_codon:yes gene_type:complete
MNKFLIISFFVISLGISSSDLEEYSLDSDVYPFDNKSDEVLFYSLLDELRCPKCQSSNLSGSNSPISNDLKREVYELVLDDNSSEEIKSFLVKRYGNFIIYNPPLEPATYILWFGPFLLLIMAALIIYLLRKRL